MVRKLVFFFWVLVAWIAPAAIAGALGWKGVWGSGGAFADYLIPVPVAGGVLHVPSFILVSAVLFTQPWAGWLGGYVRGLLLAGALIGMAILLDLHALQLAATTDATGGRFWQEQPLGLFILTDCVIAQLFVGTLGGRWPDSAREWSVSLVMVLTVPVVFAVASLQADPRQQSPFVFAGSRPTEQRGDEMVFYYSKLPLTSEAFRRAATAVIERHDPRSSLNTEDVAVYFFDSLGAAQAQNKGGAKYTACLYQDGTPTVWNPGSFDCFGSHESFSERREKAFVAQNRALPQDVRLWLARREACRGRKPITAPAGVYIDNQEIRACDPAISERARQELLTKFAGDENAVAALR